MGSARLRCCRGVQECIQLLLQCGVCKFCPGCCPGCCGVVVVPCATEWRERHCFYNTSRYYLFRGSGKITGKHAAAVFCCCSAGILLVLISTDLPQNYCPVYCCTGLIAPSHWVHGSYGPTSSKPHPSRIFPLALAAVQQ